MVCHTVLLCCSNTLELPNYAEALAATQPQLAAEWAAHLEAARQQHQQQLEVQGSSLTACPMLREECCRVLDDRLMVAVSYCQQYGLDTS
jgi:hypothetical protein